jgi:hypothetical protein
VLEISPGWRSSGAVAEMLLQCAGPPCTARRGGASWSCRQGTVIVGLRGAQSPAERLWDVRDATLANCLEVV